MSDALKKAAAVRAVDFIESGMVLGLGTGSTTRFALLEIGKRLRSGNLQEIVGIPSSLQTEQIAREEGIPVTSLDRHPGIDLTIDGADEVDDDLNLIKGGGGALLREKIIAQASKENIIIVDDSKISRRLGEKWAVPVEVLPFALGTVMAFLSQIGAAARLRETEPGEPFHTDQNNLIVDANFGVMENPHEISEQMNRRAGIIEHGLFLGLATSVIIARSGGTEIKRKDLSPAG